MSTTIKLSPRRHDQLKAIGAALGLSVTDAIASMIREKIAAGTIPADIPGIIVQPVDGDVSITIDDAQPAIYSRDVARQIADALDSVADGGSGIVSMDHNYSVVKQGTGIKVSLPFSGANAVPFKLAPSFPADLAHDLAGLIRQAAA